MKFRIWFEPQYPHVYKIFKAQMFPERYELLVLKSNNRIVEVYPRGKCTEAPHAGSPFYIVKVNGGYLRLKQRMRQLKKDALTTHGDSLQRVDFFINLPSSLLTDIQNASYYHSINDIMNYFSSTAVT
jgi:hypothetical protein